MGGANWCSISDFIFTVPDPPDDVRDCLSVCLWLLLTDLNSPPTGAEVAPVKGVLRTTEMVYPDHVHSTVSATLTSQLNFRITVMEAFQTYFLKALPCFPQHLSVCSGGLIRP